MRIVIAPDSFKGSMRSPEACEAIRGGILCAMPEATVISVPMTDGGEGTVEAAVLAAAGSFVDTRVHDPLGRKRDARFGILGSSGTAVLEMAAASGMELLARDELDPAVTTTYGTGELILSALDMGVAEIILGIGGSATVDGGSGMAQALGCRLIDRDGSDHVRGCSGGGLKDLADVDPAGMDPRLDETRIRVACDVTNPLLGPNGAARVYGPQKGAGADMVEVLEAGMRNLASIWRRRGMLQNPDRPGDGAAGGLGAGLRAFCDAELLPGAELMMQITGLKEHISQADLVITGEGCTDAQTASGKLCGAVAEAARDAGKPAILLSGQIEPDLDDLFSLFAAVFCITAGPCTLEEAMAGGRENLFAAARNISGLLKALTGGTGDW